MTVPSALTAATEVTVTGTGNTVGCPSCQRTTLAPGRFAPEPGRAATTYRPVPSIATEATSSYPNSHDGGRNVDTVHDANGRSWDPGCGDGVPGVTGRAAGPPERTARATVGRAMTASTAATAAAARTRRRWRAAVAMV